MFILPVQMIGFSIFRLSFPNSQNITYYTITKTSNFLKTVINYAVYLIPCLNRLLDLKSQPRSRLTQGVRVQVLSTRLFCHAEVVFRLLWYICIHEVNEIYV